MLVLHLVLVTPIHAVYKLAPSKTNRMVTLITIVCSIPLMMASPSQYPKVHFIHNLDYMCINLTYVQLSPQSGRTL